jgi:tRNA-specific adenosine deaminase 1
LNSNHQKSDDLLNDSHAEIICKRNFQAVLLSEAISLRNNGVSKLLSTSSGTIPYRLKPDIRLAMYVSQAPCGDSSNEQLLNKLIEDETKLPIKRKSCTFENGKTDLALRGRDRLHIVGVLRTKPARADCISTFSMSCSDKIARWNILGLCGAILSRFIEPCHLSILVVGDLFNLEALKRLNTRIVNCKFQSDYYHINKLEIFKTSIQFIHSKYSCIENKITEPLCCPSSVSWALGYPSESIVNGRKQGAAMMKNGSWPQSSASNISRKKLLDRIPMLLGHDNLLTYEQLKMESHEYQRIKFLLLQVVFEGWIGNSRGKVFR